MSESPIRRWSRRFLLHFTQATGPLRKNSKSNFAVLPCLTAEKPLAFTLPVCVLTAGTGSGS
uniref:Uncharacterized protein n=1 Tax=Anguilla anguilla TaxID=7936 RepID=A0A0E9VIF5_ANGAN